MKTFVLGYFIEFEAKGVDVIDAHHRIESAFLDELESGRRSSKTKMGSVDGLRLVEAPEGTLTITRLLKQPRLLVGYEKVDE